MVSPYDPKRPFILLTAQQASRVRGRRLAPALVDAGDFVLRDSVLFDPANAEHIPFLLTLPRCALLSDRIVNRHTIKPAASLPKPPRAKPKDGTNPWSRTVLPVRGDWSDAALYQSIGRALSRWEEFEQAFSDLFLALLSPSFYSQPALRAYGAVVTFKGRLEMIEAAAEAHFAPGTNRPPRPTTQALCKDVIRLADKLSPRRNDIAHGIVGPYVVPPNKQSRGLALMPSEYSMRHRSLRTDVELALPGDFLNTYDDGEVVLRTTPAYAYTTLEIDHFSDQFAALARRTRTTSEDVHLRYCSERGAPRGSVRLRQVLRHRKIYRTYRR